MDAARIEFGKGMAKPEQPASLKIKEVDGELRLTFTLTINAEKVDPRKSGDKRRFRDAILGKELLIGGKGNVELRKVADDKDTSVLQIYLTADTDTKIPGTGASFISAVDFEEFRKILQEG